MEQKPKIIVNEKTGIIEIDLSTVSLMIVPKGTAQIALQNVKIVNDAPEKTEKSVVLKDKKVKVVEPDKPKKKPGRKPTVSEFTIKRIDALTDAGKTPTEIEEILKHVPEVNGNKIRHYMDKHRKALKEMRASPVAVIDKTEDDKLRKFRIAEQRYKVNGAID